jgi:hypothetical protein
MFLTRRRKSDWSEDAKEVVVQLKCGAPRCMRVPAIRSASLHFAPPEVDEYMHQSVCLVHRCVVCLASLR